MLRITILCVGKIKEGFYREALAEYSKRLSRYCKFEVIEVPDEMTPDKASEAENQAILQKEAERILAKIRPGATVVTLEIEGKRMTSEKFAQWIGNQGIEGHSDLIFVIGGSLGLSPSVCKTATLHLSFSDMTFPHQLMRVILAEQIYRGFRILNSEPYHK